MRLEFNSNYFTFFAIFLFVEIAIATLIPNGFIRHTFGDFIVVLLLYCLFMAFLPLKPLYAALLTWTIAFIIEILQIFKVLNYFSLEDNSILKLVLGNTFSFLDLLAYTLGIATIILVELKIFKK